MNKVIMVTGITGNLGAYAARKMLLNGDTVVAIVRSRNANARKRAIKSMESFGKMSDLSNVNLDEKLIVIHADIGDIDLKNKINNIYIDETWHFASTLMFLPKDSDIIYDVNVNSLNNIIDTHLHLSHDFAKFNYISTAYVIGGNGGVLQENRLNYDGDMQFHNEYERTKLIAENLVLDCSQSNKLNSTIFRPSIVVADRTTKSLVNYHGYYMGVNALAKMAKFFKKNNIQEDIRVNIMKANTLNLIPIDEAVNQMLIINDINPESGSIFNVHNESETNLSHVFEVAGNSTGLNIIICDSDEYLSKKRSKYEKLVAYSMTYTMPYCLDDISFSNERTKDILGKSVNLNLAKGYLHDITEQYAKYLNV